jgi:hypothetical protein
MNIGKRIRKEDKADDATLAAYPTKFPKIQEWLGKGGFKAQGAKLRVFSKQNRGIVAACNMP